MAKFKNKYRVESHRRKGWDYGATARYFVTINCENRRHFFGHIENNQMILSPVSEIADRFWKSIPDHFSHIILHNHVIMPDHMHGIIEIIEKYDPKTPNPSVPEDTSREDLKTPNLGVSIDRSPEHPKTPNLGVSSHNLGVSGTSSPSATAAANATWKPQTLGVIINQYKRICTIHARKINPDFGWQRNYHDIIIPDQRAFETISLYIKNNPKNWKT